ncbi:MAG: hypothetical protein NZ772_06045 [Cyanobacteria bacterium]|nr:hypothetical protein [Cyanobacteriota bacterium]MDW8199640.1 Sll0314/Alr1548 family TPR repeat-containing protein [Cyanobacteriota bacterium SKYGB_h_bin112]
MMIKPITHRKQMGLPLMVQTHAKKFVAITSLATLVMGLWVTPALARDPFRSSNARSISDQVSAAFDSVFVNGNYPQARNYLDQADSAEPMSHAMRASLAFTSGDLATFQTNATLTRQTAEQLVSRDPLRGNLYIAVGHFLEGAYILLSDGTVRGTPRALGKLQEVFKYIKEAEKIDKNDPELNLIKGYMDLMLAVNLPFADVDQAIERLERYAGPRYLAIRGIAYGYRDLGQYSKALDYINRALKDTPNNPEVHYTKAQILVQMAKQQNSPALYAEAAKSFKVAVQKSDQLPRVLVWQIFFEYCLNQNTVDGQPRNCVALRDTIDLRAGIWGPTPDNMPKL